MTSSSASGVCTACGCHHGAEESLAEEINSVLKSSFPLSAVLQLSLDMHHLEKKPCAVAQQGRPSRSAREAFPSL